MKPLIIEGDNVTPRVNFNAGTGVLKISGLAIPEDVRTMFLSIKEWISEYSKKPQPATELVFNFEYLNTAATKVIYELGCIVSQIHNIDGCRVRVTWQYTRGDVEMHELGEEILEDFFCQTEIQVIDELDPVN